MINTSQTVLLQHTKGRGYGAGARPGLQIRCSSARAGEGGFDSHALPPDKKTLTERSVRVFYLHNKSILLLVALLAICLRAERLGPIVA
ncbi:MAG TPA: hypothetical protein DCO77_05870 [Nitrospiraceae bacterium]|nr:hypothetical protein [Nitrospiraceae bacterium]